MQSPHGFNYMDEPSWSGGVAYENDSRKMCNAVRKALTAANIPLAHVRSRYTGGARIVEIKVAPDWKAVKASGLDWHKEYVDRAKEIAKSVLPERAGFWVTW